MFLCCTTRKKNGKEHRYYSLVENRRATIRNAHGVAEWKLFLNE